MISATHHVITVSADVVVCHGIEWREGIDNYHIEC